MARIAPVLLLGLAAGAQAQGLRLPTLPLVPQLPIVSQLPAAPQLSVLSPSPSDPNLLRALGTQTDIPPAQQRRQRVRELLRRYRNVLEADPAGEAMVRGDVVALSPADADLATARTAGFSVEGVRILDGLDARIVVLRAPAGIDTAAALARLRALVPGGNFDFNHVYAPSGDLQAAPAPRTVGAAAANGAAPRELSPRVGLIDGGVDGAHPVFRGVLIHRHGCGEVAVPDPHGTAVASLLVGRAPQFRGAAPGAELYAADVYCGAPTGGAVDALADAFAWLVRMGVPVINVSLVGPSNSTLQAVVQKVLARGVLIVAAVGNDGPAAPPLYPASYPGVIGVTAVDARRHALPEAAQGPQVRFAAPGADMAAACSPQAFALVRGTSFAAPLVAGLLALQYHGQDPAAAARAIDALAHQAVDLGAPGRDAVYGYGLVGADLGPQARLASLHLP